MYTQTQLEVIRIFGRKELMEGCIVRKEKGKWFKIANIADIKYPDGKTYYKKAKGYGVHGKFYQPNFKTESDIEILGHIPHLEDVFRVAEEKGYKIEIHGNEDGYIILFFSGKGSPYFLYNPTLPLLEQEETLKQLITLFK